MLETPNRRSPGAVVPGGEESSAESVVFYPVLFTSAGSIFNVLIKIKTIPQKAAKQRRPLIPSSGVRELCGMALAPATPSPVPDLLEQGRVLVISELASSRPRHVHDVGVGGHQNDVQWVLQLAAEGWGQKAGVS